MIRLNPLQSPFKVTLNINGDKSISHRALILASLAYGKSTITGLSQGADVRSTMNILKQLGVKVSQNSNKTNVNSEGLSGFHQPDQTLDAGNSGTTLRLMTGLLCGLPFPTEISGDNSLNRRPMKRIIEPLSKMGAIITASPDETAPLRIKPSELRGIDYTLPVASAQVKSALILAGLQVQSGETVIREQTRSRRHTELMLQSIGAPVKTEDTTVRIQSMETPLEPFDIEVPGDPSSAAFWATAAAIIPDSSVLLKNICLSPERIGFFRILKKSGLKVTIELKKQYPEPVGDIQVYFGPLSDIVITAEEIPSLVDEVPLVAVLGAFNLGHKTVVRGAKELRIKESDRISAIVYNLRQMNVPVQEFDDGFEIKPSNKPEGGEFRSFGDHRIAMAFSIAALGAEGDSTIDDENIARISYPEFWHHYQLLRKSTIH